MARQFSNSVRREDEDWVVDVLTGIVMFAVQSLVAGWSLMLAVHIAHTSWVPELPGIGYWWAVLIAIFLRAAGT